MSDQLGPTPRTSDPLNIHMMRLALKEAVKCTPSPGAFCVGCIISDIHGPMDWFWKAGEWLPREPLSAGYSRELEGNTHAEANALDKLASSSQLTPEDLKAKLADCLLYTTLEPCSVRTSGLKPCVERILESGIKRVYMGVEEPSDFVVCEGVRILREAGVEVWVVVDPEGDLAKDCLDAARRSA